ncbi:DUF1992 domain-containing protein [Quadrisphaera sp. DSM 44207]|uniref:DnaJ family domain-containing protein n=1 Tax=Quadrisphaera sp. DSM 44207 TaxID=1881057 RepID=UPI00088B76CB|nr:DUF1992 domain-containing protein [Quadrisphaera sp. DSM 44207]SDQ35671.1 protein of unknown function [Quadrisphaera sp. DSM 44207]
MTQRKPPQVPFETWVDRQIRVAQERGEFDNLSLAGKPLPKGRPSTTDEWTVEWAKREGADLTAMLPLSLALAKEREELTASLPRQGSEAQVRALVQDFNARLDQAYRRPPDGPPLALAPIGLDAALRRWREAHPRPAPSAEPEPPVARRRWWHWERRIRRAGR